MISPALEEGGVDESGRGEASVVKDYACCGREDDLDQGLDYRFYIFKSRGARQGEDAGRSPKTRNHAQTTLYIEEL